MKKPEEKVTLTGEQETLLIPLYAKAIESGRANPIFNDAIAEEILDSLDYDFAGLSIPRKTSITLCIRAKKFDEYTRKYISEHPKSTIIHLGCGLDSRCLRVEPNVANWYDLDLKPVIDLRAKFYKETATYHMIAASVMDFRWIDQIAPEHKSVLVVAEGLFMYLKETEVKALMLKVKEAFLGCHLAFDAYSTMTSRHAKNIPSVKKTGAQIKWGIDKPEIIESWDPGIRVVEEWFFSKSEDIGKLGIGYRLAFRLASLFKAANRAHRILYVRM